MSRPSVSRKSSSLVAEAQDLKISHDTAGGAERGTPAHDTAHSPAGSNGTRSSNFPTARQVRRPSTQVSKNGTPQSPAVKSDQDDTVGGEISVKLEPGTGPKLSRSQSKKVAARPPPLFSHEPDALQEALQSFDILTDCTYINKFIGTTDHALECDCSEEWNPEKSVNEACGEDSDCINRATKMECVSDCSCGDACQNRRFQRKEYANVTVFKTEKKGYGLRADTNLQPNTLIFEYIGEVIGEAQFDRRLEQYDREKIKHFYFMSLNKGEFVDATKKGNLGRFCNHSCNPNCYVDKWVVHDRLRMGIFSERAILEGEELTFNYNVDRYGAEPQACYCGEPNCTGYIGGKTQTERGTKLPAATIEALGLEDGEDWDLAVAKKGRGKKKTAEIDEEYVERVEPKELDETAVNKVMAILMQCKEQWICVKLLNRIQKTEDTRIKGRVVRMHGYRIFKQVLTTFVEDDNIIIQVLEILDSLPRLTRNKIQDSRIEDTVRSLTEKDDERVKARASGLLEAWEALEVGYRIPRMKRENGNADRAILDDRRRERDRSNSRTRQRSPSKSPPRGPANAPSGPKNRAPQRSGFPAGPRRIFAGVNRLPLEWFEAVDGKGKPYYYTKDGRTTWTKPTEPAGQKPSAQAAAPVAVPKPTKTKEQIYQDIINSITASASDARNRPSSTSTPKSGPEPSPLKKEPKWKSYSEEKKMKLYENTIHPHIKHVTDKYHHKIPKEDIKKHARELCKKFVASDFKKNRVKDPTKIDKDQIKAIQSFTKDYFQKLLRKTREKKEVAAAAKPIQINGLTQGDAEPTGQTTTPPGSPGALLNDDDDDGLPHKLSPDSPMDEPPTPSADRKRKIDDDADEDIIRSPNGLKRVKSDMVLATPPPPPPPPPATDGEAPADLELKTNGHATEEVPPEADHYDSNNNILATIRQTLDVTDGQ